MPFVWDPGERKYRDTNTGDYLSEGRVLEIVDQSIQLSVNRAGAQAKELANNRLNYGEVERGIRDELKKAYIRQYLLGRGGRSAMEASDWGILGSQLKNQYRYLNRLIFQSENEGLSEDLIKSRLSMYYRSSRQAYERASVQSYGAVELPAYPGDGSTLCMSNCKCYWQIEERLDFYSNLKGWDCYWRLSSAEHCVTCVNRSTSWNPLFIAVNGNLSIVDRDLLYKCL